MADQSNGCHHHADCFTCPFPDCVAGQKNRPREESTLAPAQQTKRREYKRQWYIQNKDRIRLRELQKEFPHLDLSDLYQSKEKAPQVQQHQEGA